MPSAASSRVSEPSKPSSHRQPDSTRLKTNYYKVRSMVAGISLSVYKPHWNLRLSARAGLAPDSCFQAGERSETTQASCLSITKRFPEIPHRSALRLPVIPEINAATRWHASCAVFLWPPLSAPDRERCLLVWPTGALPKVTAAKTATRAGAGNRGVAQGMSLIPRKLGDPAQVVSITFSSVK